MNILTFITRDSSIERFDKKLPDRKTICDDYLIDESAKLTGSIDWNNVIKYYFLFLSFNNKKINDFFVNCVSINLEWQSLTIFLL